MKLLKNLLFAALCLVSFGAAAVLSFALSAASLVQNSLAPIYVDWSDSTGQIYNELSYGEGEFHTYDLYVPAGPQEGQNYSLILLIHGGGFTGGDKGGDVAWGKYFASKGLLCASINYTLLREDTITGLPVMFQDTRDAVNAICVKAGELGYHLTEMAVTGSSAGGTLALMYAYNPPEDAPLPVRFVFEQTGPVSFASPAWGEAAAEDGAISATVMTGRLITPEMVESGEYRQYVDAISPVTYVNENTVPTLMAYGPKDKIVPPALKYLLLDALEAHGVSYDYIEFPNSGHGLLNDPDKMAEYVAKIDAYIEAYFENHCERNG